MRTTGSERPGDTVRRIPYACPWIAFLGSSLFAQSQSQGQARFVDLSESLGLECSGESAAWGDCNGDGWSDLLAGGRLWLNDSGDRFRAAAELPDGVLVDFDRDGDLDLFSCAGQRLFLNDGTAAFKELELEGLPRTRSRGVAAGDFDQDGWIDFYVGGFEDWGENITYPDHLLRNLEGKGLALVWSDGRYRARGVTAADFDEDGDVDVYVSNYRLQPNLLWRNDGAGGFSDVAESLGVLATSAGFQGGHSIGAAWGDFDDDGQLDLFAGNFAHRDDRGDQPKSRFLRGLGEADGFSFEDQGTCGVFYQESYASPAAGDYDNDGDLDLFFTTVYPVASFGLQNNPVLYRNNRDWEFEDITGDIGLGELPATYQAAWADFDRDGDMDLVTAGKLFVNRGEVGHWLELRLAAPVAGGLSHASVIGANARIRQGERVLSRHLVVGTGEGNQNDGLLHFALDLDDSWDGTVEVEVSWPPGHGRDEDGRRQLYTVREIDRVVTLTPQPEASK
ncbi:hypothetical protein CMO84_08200 [Candidatus Woesearchaeota archaeon]|nr:hypothetical protein [Candidatus Woesearchaeota archaeon]